jgi:uncharacterized protein
MTVLSSGAPGVNWRQVGLFLGVTFLLTWLLNFALRQTGGYTGPATLVTLQLMMLIPAFSALALGMFVFKDSPINFRRLSGAGRLFALYVLAYTLFYFALAAGAMASSEQARALTSLGLPATLLGLVLVVAIRLLRGPGALAGLGLRAGRPIYWLLFGAGFVLFYASQTLLNYLFGLGHPVDTAPLAQQFGMPVETFLIVSGLQSVLVASILGLMLGLGEEYGWRGYLQGELTKLGRIKGVLLVGVIWGVWHAPTVAMGHNYPGYPVLGPVLMVAYTVLMAVVLGYAVLKSGSVWLAAFLHTLNNQTYSFFVTLVHAPDDSVLSFGGGIFGIALTTGIVLLILRDPVWREGQPGPTDLPALEGEIAAKPPLAGLAGRS